MSFRSVSLQKYEARRIKYVKLNTSNLFYILLYYKRRKMLADDGDANCKRGGGDRKKGTP